ncbi:MAG: ComEC/Rec2 family competence protein [Sphaerochaeta sp.]
MKCNIKCRELLNPKIFVDAFRNSKCSTFLFNFKIYIYVYSSMLLVFGYTNDEILYEPWLFVLLSSVVFAFLVVFSSFNYIKIWIVCSFLFSMYLLTFTCASNYHAPLPCRECEVIGVEGSVLNDVSETKSGNFIIKIKCSRVFLRSDTSISYSGEMTVLSKENYNLMKTSFISCNTYYDDELDFFKADGVKVFSTKRYFSFEKKDINLTLENIKWQIRVKRHELQNYIFRNIKSTLARLLLLGQCDSDGFIFKESALRVGCSHLLALSGMHLSYISSFFSFLIVFLLRNKRGGKVIGKRLSIIFPFLFVFVAGALSSLIRALFMYVLSLFIDDKKLKKEIVFTLSMSFQLLFFGFSILEIGMVLSYSIIASLSVLNLFFEKSRGIVSMFLSTAVALTVSYPLGKLFGGDWSIASLAVAPIGSLLISASMFISLLLLIVTILLNMVLYLMNLNFYGSVFRAILLLVANVLNYLKPYLNDKIDYLEHLLASLFNFGIKVPLYLPTFYSGQSGFEVYFITLLTAWALYMYSMVIIRYRRQRIYELELSIRFPKCNNAGA